MMKNFEKLICIHGNEILEANKEYIVRKCKDDNSFIIIYDENRFTGSVSDKSLGIYSRSYFKSKKELRNNKIKDILK